jgi:hypothetical protein
MIDTVAADLGEDASEMLNAGAKSEVYRLAGMLADAGRAIESEDWAAAERQWAAFKSLQAEIDAKAY